MNFYTKKLVFWVCWFFIGIVSAFDCYLTVKLSETLYLFEENPFVKTIMDHNNKQVDVVIAAKFLGNVFVLGLLAISLKSSNPSKKLLFIIASLAIAQFDLLLYLI